MPNVDDLNNRFTYHAPKNDEQIRQFQEVRRAGLDLVVLMCGYAPESRELALAITKIEEAVMWANAAIARH